MSEFSRRVNVEVFKEEPQTFDEWVEEREHCDETNGCPDCKIEYRQYLDGFQPYWWHAQSPNGEILTNGEHYTAEAGVINSVEVLFGGDTTMYWAPMYGEDRGEHLLRYGKTDRDNQAAQK
jgi:hypothetical protein